MNESYSFGVISALVGFAAAAAVAWVAYYSASLCGMPED